MQPSKMSQVLSKYDDQRNTTLLNEVKKNFRFGKEYQYEVSIAQDLNSKIEAYDLMYRLYRTPEIGYAKEDPTKLWYSIFNANPTTTTFIIRNLLTKKMIATLTVVLDSTIGLPLEENYPKQIADLRNKKRRCAEIISLGFDEVARGSCEIMLQLFKQSYLVYRGIYSVTDFLIMIKPGHALFYEKKLLFNLIGAEMNCTKINNKPVMLYHIDLTKAEIEAQNQTASIADSKKNHNRDIYKSFMQSLQNKEIIKSLKTQIINAEMSASDLEYLFVQLKPIFRKSCQKKLHFLEKNYRNHETKAHIQGYCQELKNDCLLV